MRTACIIGLVCLLPTAAHAAEEGSTSKSKHDLLERRVFLPSLLGFGAGTAPLVIGSSAVGFSTYPSGIVSYMGAESSNGSSAAHVDSFSFNPSVDVRVGRFTIGGGLSIAYSRSSLTGQGEASSTTFELAPRVGYLVPITHDIYLWPRVSAGVLFGQASATLSPTSSVTGAVAGADVLLVVALGSHFFLTVGPSGWIDAAWEPNVSSSSFGIGASVGLGVAL